ncbi:MAG: hypothetical protein WA705_02285 [Candidatus Ozemobacteraceae bacterium]
MGRNSASHGGCGRSCVLSVHFRPEGGKISIVLNDKGGADTECSRHGTVDTPSAQAKQADDDKKDASFNYYSKLAATPEYDRLVDECMKFYDDVLLCGFYPILFVRLDCLGV